MNSKAVANRVKEKLCNRAGEFFKEIFQINSVCRRFRSAKNSGCLFFQCGFDSTAPAGRIHFG